MSAWFQNNDIKKIKRQLEQIKDAVEQNPDGGELLAVRIIGYAKILYLLRNTKLSPIQKANLNQLIRVIPNDISSYDSHTMTIISAAVKQARDSF